MDISFTLHWMPICFLVLTKNGFLQSTLVNTGKKLVFSTKDGDRVVAIGLLSIDGKLRAINKIGHWKSQTIFQSNGCYCSRLDGTCHQAYIALELPVRCIPQC